MNLRLAGNSLRFRMTTADVDQLADGKSVNGVTRFTPDSDLKYRVQPSDAVSVITASLESENIVVRVPEALAIKWARGDGVSLSATQTLGDGELLKILIEKDFHS